MKTQLIIFTLFCSLLLNCTKNKTHTIKDTDPAVTTNAIEFYGSLKKLEVSSFMYGTHYISNGSQSYALKSSTVDLNAYINKNVTITGTKIVGYPVDGGPDYVDVKTVR